MVAVVGEHGYGGASVDRVVARAGTSKASFYERFSSRDECFAAAYGSCLEEAMSNLHRLGTVPQRGRARALIEIVFERAAERPAAARLLLVEALGGPRRVRLEHESLIGRAEGCLQQLLGVTKGAILPLPAMGLIGAVGSIAAIRVLLGRELQLSEAIEPLVAWAESYGLGGEALSEGTGVWTSRMERWATRVPGPAAPGFPLLPRGRQSLPATAAADERRRRILDATTLLCERQGYKALTVGKIVSTARVPRSAFYSLFGGKEEAFLAAQSAILRESIAVAAAEYFTAGDWPDRVWNGLAGLFAYLAERPQAATLGLVEIYAVGAPAVLREHEIRSAYTIFLEEGYKQNAGAGSLPHLFSEAIAAAIYAIARRQVVQNRARRMLDVLPQCAYIALAPFIGSTEAMRFITTKV